MIHVLSNINLEPIKGCFRGEAISFGGYGQTEREIADLASALYKPGVDQALLFLDGEEFLRDRAFHIPDETVTQSVLGDLGQLLSQLDGFLASARSVAVTINTMALPPRTFLSHLNANSTCSFAMLENRMNDAIATFASRHPNAVVLDWRGIVTELGYDNLIDDKFWYMARVKLNQTALNALAAEYKRLRRAYTAGPKKVLALDLDNTLWGGILGEAGLGGIQLGEDGLGKAYREFQQALKGLAEVGVVLAVVSKNNEEEALEALRNHPMMALRPEDFACLRINWKAKPENLIDAARSLNIGLDSMVFIDDSPVERSLMSASLPEVAVPEFPSEPTGLKRWLLGEVVPEYFGKLRLTGEDRDKTRQYRANSARAETASRLSVEEYLRSLEIKTTAYEKPESHRLRIAQLIQKTNQFNLTGRRYSEGEISRIYEDPSQMVFALDYEDRFGREGVVAAAVARIAGDGAEIDSFVMSCRVIGRNVEYAMLAHILDALRARGVRRLTAEYLRTPKNSVAEDFYPKAGFERRSESMFEIELKTP